MMPMSRGDDASPLLVQKMHRLPRTGMRKLDMIIYVGYKVSALEQAATTEDYSVAQ
jgi:hypothetical protein